MRDYDPSMRFARMMRVRYGVGLKILAAAVVITLLGAATDQTDVGQGLLEYRQARPAEALEDWARAADAGDSRGALYIGVLYDTGRGVSQDYRKAMTWYKRAWDMGSAAGAFNLAVLYDAGLGVAQDQATAAGWYARAASRGFARAEYNLAMIYETGTGAPEDRGLAAALYRRAAGHGITAARAHLVALGQPFTGKSRQPDDTATEEFQKAEQVLLSRGPAEAARMTGLLRRSADLHNALAEYDLGYCYAYGLGVTRDPSQALGWYRRAVEDATDDAIRSIAKSGIDSLPMPNNASQTVSAGDVSSEAADIRARVSGVATRAAAPER